VSNPGDLTSCNYLLTSEGPRGPQWATGGVNRVRWQLDARGSRERGRPRRPCLCVDAAVTARHRIRGCRRRGSESDSGCVSPPASLGTSFTGSPESRGPPAQAPFTGRRRGQGSPQATSAANSPFDGDEDRATEGCAGGPHVAGGRRDPGPVAPVVSGPSCPVVTLHATAFDTLVRSRAPRPPRRGPSAELVRPDGLRHRSLAGSSSARRRKPLF
jgi:hypothetical protein